MIYYSSSITMCLSFAERIFPIILSCVKDIENCGLCVDVISTDNYPLNVKLFKLFSPVGKLETCVPHPCVPNKSLYLTFDFVHILKSVRNNWLNLKSSYKCFFYPDFDYIGIDYCSFPLRLCFASFQDVPALYSSEKESIAILII